MRLSVLALTAGAVILTACAGGEQADTATTSDTVAAGVASTQTTSGTAAPITGTVHEVRMLIDERGNYRYEPQNLTVRQGDGVRFVMVSGAPHNVAFDPAKTPDDVEAQLSANMPNQMGPLTSPMLMQPNETWTMSFANIPAGRYEYVCTPHLAMGMTGTIVVQ